MISSDRRAADRRGRTPVSSISLGAVLAVERRARPDRREQPRRQADLRNIAQLARRINAGQTRLEVIVDGTEGMRLVAMFACGCRATEPIGAGTASVRAEWCGAHAAPAVTIDRRLNR
jgi:hypothetical protein